MASIIEKHNKKGTSYKIVVSDGFDRSGKQVRHSTTYTPPAGMSSKAAHKEAERLSYKLEENIRKGIKSDSRETLCEYAEYVLEMKDKNGDLKVRTLERYRELMVRINEALGRLKIVEIQPRHLNQFYQNLAEKNIRATPATAKAREDLQKNNIKKLSFTAISHQTNISASTIGRAFNGQSVTYKTANAIAQVLNKPVSDLFEVHLDDSPLSPKTILEYHRLISVILQQGVDDMILEYNAAARAKPPKAGQPKIHYYQPEEVKAIIAELVNVPLKWRCLTLLLIFTGCRRGEIASLQWKEVDFQRNSILIDSALLYSAKKGVYEDTTKSSENRLITDLPEMVMDNLRDLYKNQTELKSNIGEGWNESDYVFVNDAGNHIHPDSITGWLNTFSANNSLPHIHPHAFRHTVASTLISQHVDVVTLANVLGHANSTTTLKVYSHVIDNEKCNAVSGLNKAFLGD